MAKKKEVIGQIKLQIPGGAATPAPPVGPALGAKGVNIGAFVKEFNDATAKRRGEVVPVVIDVYKDKSFSFIMKEPPMAELIKKIAGIEKGSGTAGPLTKHAVLTDAQVSEVAERKLKELTAHDLDAAKRTVAGTARSMGLVVEG
jgi:large subunit ribosomal protein L11